MTKKKSSPGVGDVVLGRMTHLKLKKNDDAYRKDKKAELINIIRTVRRLIRAVK